MTAQSQSIQQQVKAKFREEIASGKLRTLEEARDRIRPIIREVGLKPLDRGYLTLMDSLMDIANGAFDDVAQNWEDVEVRIMDGDVSAEEWDEIEARIMDGDM